MIFSRLKIGKPKKALCLIVAVALFCNGLFVWMSTQNADAVTGNDYRWRNDDGTEITASWAAAQDTAITNVAKNEAKRLRFGMADDETYRTADLTLEFESTQVDAGIDEDKLVGFIDAGTYAYSVWDAYDYGTTGGSVVYKHNKSTGAVVDTFAPTDLWYPTDAVLGSGGTYLYFTAESATNTVLVRLNLSNFDTYSTLNLGLLSSSYKANAVDIDSTGTYAYVSVDDFNTYSTRVYKVNLGTFSVSTSVAWAYADYGWETLDGVIDSGDDYLYYRMYGDYGDPGNYLIIKINLASFASGPIDILILDSIGADASDFLAIDAAGTYLYYTSYEWVVDAYQGYVNKVQASDLTVVSSYALPNGAGAPGWLGTDDTNGFLYITDTYGGALKVTEIDLATFTYSNELSIASNFRSETIGFTDGANTALYLGGALDDYTAYFAKIDTTRDQNDMEYAFRLEYGVKSTTCGAIGAWTTVAATDAGSEHWAMRASDNFINEAVTTNVSGGLADGETTFVSGRMMDTASTTPVIALAVGEFTEVEYSIAPTSDATGGGNYCFRLTDGGAATAFTFSTYAEASIYSGTSNVQNAYRWRNDNGTETTATWAAAENTPITGLAKETPRRLRLGTSAGSGLAGALSIVAESTDIDADQNYATEAVVDDGTYLYAVWTDWNSPSYVSITKIQKSDLSVLSQYDFPTNIRSAFDAAIDPGGTYLYFNATDSTAVQTVAVKFNLSTFNTYSTLNLGSSGSYAARSIDMDSTGAYLYVGVNALSSTVNGTVYKIDLSTFTSSASRALAYGTYGNNFTSGDIDDADAFLYYATNRYGYTTYGRLIKMDLSDFSGAAIDVENIYLSGTYYYPHGSLVVDQSGDYLYFTMLSGIFGIGKVTTSTLTFTNYTALTGRTGTPYWTTPMAIDNVNEYLYFTDYNYESDMKIYAVDLRNFTVADSLSLGITDTSMSGAYVDETNGHVYTAGYGGSGTAADFQKIAVKTRYSIQPRLEYGAKETTCAAISTWTQVPISDANTEHWTMSDSVNITNGEATTNVAPGIGDGNTTFSAGHVMDTASTTAAIEMSSANFTEVEYVIEATSDAEDGAEYCFRMTDAGTPDDFYYRTYGEVTLSGGTDGVTTQVKLLLSRNKVNATGVAFSLTFDYTGVSDGTLTVTFPAEFTVTSAATDAGSSDCLSSFGYTATTLTAAETGCTGSVTIGGATITNPSTPGAYRIYFTGSGGEGEVYINDDDQVTITSDVDPSLSFNVGTSTSCDGTFSGNGGTLALGVIDAGTVTTSDVSGVSHICTRVSTNATLGAAITARSLYGALTSTSAPADTIDSATATLVAGTEGYGLCVGSAVGHTGKDTTTPAGADPTASAPFASSCDTSNHNVGGLTTGNQDVWTIDGPSQNAYARVFVKASIATTTPAHGDYTDTLTFIATATY